MGLRYALALTLIGFTAASPSAQRLDTSSALKLTRAYLKKWQQSLAAVVAEEHYTQTMRDGRSLGETTRTLVSDVLLVHAAGEDGWLLFRDVLTVDDEAVRDRQRRFDQLFVRPDANLVATARKIADEGARYNLGRVFRNLNTPIATLVFLADKYTASVRWQSPKRVDLDGSPALELAFEQKRAPFAVRSLDGKPQPASGRIWIEPASGQVRQTELLIVENAFDISRPNLARIARTRVVIGARFGPVAHLDVWVPLRMTEDYIVSSDVVLERMDGQALYSNHRQFQTSARIVKPS
jgi:hypothetical protein